jgi:hypothetical protein
MAFDGDEAIDRLARAQHHWRQEHTAAGEAPWPEPRDLLGQKTETAAPFPIQFLPGVLQDFVADAADRMQCPVDFIAVPQIIEAATLIGKNFRLAPKAADDWTERPCLWGGIIADPATLKTPAFNSALRPTRQFQREFREQHQADIEEYKLKLRAAQYVKQQWKEDCKKAAKAGKEMPEMPAAAEPPNPPKLRRLLTSDTTQEALVDLIEQNPRGLLLFRDELSAWFASFNQYRPGSDRQFYLECHSGGSHAKDRRVGSVLIEDLYLNICGGVQPEIVTKVLGGGDFDGMTARFSMLVWPDPSGAFVYVDRRPDSVAQQETERIMRELLALDPERFFGPDALAWERALRFDKPGQEIFFKWYTKTQLRLRAGTDEPNFRAHVGKSPGLFARLAIVHHLLRYVQNDASAPAMVDAGTASAVETFIDEYLEPHARRIYRHLGRDPAYHGAQRIARWIIGEPSLVDFTARTIRQKDWSGLTNHDSVNLALDHLENVAGWVRCEDELPGPRGGRPTTRYHVNPLVRSRF